MDFVTRFLDFKTLMGAGLVKLVYYLGLLGIGLGVIGGIFGALGTMFGLSFTTGLGMLIAVPIGGLFALCFLRFACELYIVLFRMGDDIAALREKGGVAAAPATPSAPSSPSA